MESVYLDTAATTPVDPRVAELVYRCMVDDFGNAGSRTHQKGLDALQLVEESRRILAGSVEADVTDIVFTSGATEANNLATLGLEEFGLSSGRRHIISTAIEHKAVLEPLTRLSSRGFEIDLIHPSADGAVKASEVLALVREDTLLVSVMHANNETGILQPIQEVSAGLPSDVYFHVDAAQSFGKLMDPLRDQRIDLISLSAHKIFGPKGIGALVARRRNRRRPPVTPLTLGGGQERGLRPGTQSVPLIAGLGEATAIAISENSERARACGEFGAMLTNSLLAVGAVQNGNGARLPNILNISIPGLDSEAAILLLKGTAEVSNGSACTSNKYEPSHVLQAMGLSRDRTLGAIRFSWDHSTNTEIIPVICEILKSAAVSK